MRKKGKPNPDQRYFYLVVGLHAHCVNGNHYPIVSHASERIIVRALVTQASNPGQFESDIELSWQKGQTPESVFHSGRVGVNTDRPDEALVVHGNLKLTGHLVQPSDARAKTTLRECDSREQLRNVQRLRMVQYRYRPEFARAAGLGPDAHDTGILAQDLQRVLPEAVAEAGNLTLDDGRTIDNFLVVNKERIFMENVGAVKELVKVTDNLENRIDELERMNKKLSKLKRMNSLSTCSAASQGYSTKSHKRRDDGLCNNKYIQMIIIALVLIMAFCMVAIATLYFIEFQKRAEFQIYTDYEEPFRTTTLKHHSGTQIQLVHITRRFITQKPTKAYHLITTEPEFSPSVPTGINVLRASGPILGRPSECQPGKEDFSDCQVYCCYSEPPPLDEGVSENIENRIFRETTSPANLWILPSMVGSTIDSINIHAINDDIPTTASSISSPSDKEDKEPSKRLKRSDKDNEELGENENPENPDAFHDSDLVNDITVVISGRHFNQTLGPEFLLCSLHQENYTYSVSLSKYLADPSIHLTFKMNKLTRGQMIAHFCKSGHVVNDECPILGHRDNSIQLIQEVDNVQNRTFELNISSKSFMNFQFRVPFHLSVQNPCSLPPNRLGLDFIEYNFIYHRSCDE